MLQVSVGGEGSSQHPPALRIWTEGLEAGEFAELAYPEQPVDLNAWQGCLKS